MAPSKIKKRIAIACQGGGSHTAFTAGVLKKILSQRDKTFDIVALSGTSGGAICAALTWYGLLTGSENKAIDLLDAFWRDNAADTFWDIWLNDTMVLSEKVRDFVSLPQVNPYSFSTYGQDQLKSLLNKHIEVRRIPMLRDLNYSTKLERRLEFIRDLIAYGEHQAEDFLKGLRACE